MKIAFFGFGFTGATFPLAKYLVEQGIDVDLFFLVYFSKNRHIESFEYDGEMLLPGVIRKISKNNIIYRYLPKKINVWLVPVLPEKLTFFERINFYTLSRLASRLQSSRYDVIDVILLHKYELYVYNRIKLTGICICSAHEIYETLNSSKPEIKQSLLDILSDGTPLVLHSQYLYEETLSRLPQYAHLVKCIRFGDFESYTIFDRTDTSDLNDYILFIGSIQPYKGLGLLYRAISVLPKTYKCVVAGKGNDDVLPKMKNDSRFVVLNDFVENADFVHLIKYARVVVCPYIATSQTGIVACTNLYQKPVIATNVGAFSEFIVNDVTGMIIPANDVESLANAIYKVMSDDSYYESLCENIKNKRLGDWQPIIEQYINLFTHTISR